MVNSKVRATIIILLTLILYLPLVEAQTTSAQYGLNITIIGKPVDRVLTNTRILLVFSVSWTSLQTSWYLGVALLDQTTASYVSASAVGSPSECYRPTTATVAGAPDLCVFQVRQVSGVEQVTFDFPSPSTPRTLHLQAVAGVSPSALPSLKGFVVGNSSPELSIVVVDQAQYTIFTTTTVMPSRIQVMSESSQSTVVFQPTNDLLPQLGLVIAVIAAIALVALIVYAKRGKKPNDR
jgi:hypothetical protein